MSETLIGGIVNTIIDGIKDAQMQYDYACDAKKAGEPELAKLHINEAERRMNGVAEWRKAAESFIGSAHHDDAVFAAMYAHYADWAHTLRAKIAEFKA